MNAAGASLNTKTWLVWLVAAATGALITRNPLYLCLILLITAAVNAAARRVRHKEESGNNPHTRWAGIMVALGSLIALINALTAHYGATVLLHVPEQIPVLGGNITFEALVFGLTAGLSLAATIFTFVVFNNTVSTQALLRLAPRFAYRMGVALSIAVLFVPQTIASLRQIRDAQQLRGHRVHGWRDWLPLLAPLLTLSLERALSLAEAMEARGFGGRTTIHDADNEIAQSLWFLGGATIFGLGFFLHLYEPGFEPLPTLAACAGLALLGWRLWQTGRNIRRSRYRRETWHNADSIVVGAAFIAFVTLLAYNNLGDGLLYYPYPKLTWPPFDPLIGCAYLLLATPAAILPGIVSGVKTRDNGIEGKREQNLQ